MVVFFYGGNWNSGNRADYRFAGEALASKGCVAVLPDYRLYPEVRYPEFLADSALAVRWVFDNIGAAAFGGDSRNVFLMGHSAGAYNAAMLALNPAYLRAAGVEARRLRGLIGLAGPLLADLDVRRIARPTLERLVAATGETAALFLLREGRRLCVAESVSRQVLAMARGVGETEHMVTETLIRGMYAYWRKVMEA